jgi:riboflavin synthase
VINLELPTPAGTPLGGHVVQGHVDATGTLVSLRPVHSGSSAKETETDWWMEVETPPEVGRYVVEKGSIAVEGISLTVARRDGERMGLAIIPHTYAHTNLHALREGDRLNLEADVLLKFASAGANAAQGQITLAHLLANGY